MITNIIQYESSKFSANGEDGIIDAIFRQIGKTNKHAVEFGATGCERDNTYYLRKKGWQVYLLDRDIYNYDIDPEGILQGKIPKKDVVIELITAHNINQLLKDRPDNYDFLSIDIDSNDFWVWKAMTCRPRVVCIEYNAFYPPPSSKVMPYQPYIIPDGSQYFGASFSAMLKLGKEKGYTCVGCDSTGSNMFFVLDELIEGNFQLPPLTNTLYRPPNYNGALHRPTDKVMEGY